MHDESLFSPPPLASWSAAGGSHHQPGPAQIVVEELDSIPQQSACLPAHFNSAMLKMKPWRLVANRLLPLNTRWRYASFQQVKSAPFLV